MSNNDIYEYLCKNCWIKLTNPSKNEIKRAVLSEDKEKCDKCGRTTYFVEYVEGE
jgi:predicted  nucleic acid-binding Zn-ribbon protein